MKRLIAGLPFIAAVIFGGFFLWGLNPDRDPNEIPSVLISQPAPAFDLDPVPGLETPGLARSDLVGNERPVVVNVFASWCVPCRRGTCRVDTLCRTRGHAVVRHQLQRQTRRCREVAQ